MPKHAHQGIKEEYWDINEVLRYQRNFMLINSERSIGKTYTTEKWVLEKCIKTHKQFAYIVRTKDEKKKGAFQKGFVKVETIEFQGKEFTWDTETLCIDGEHIGWCFALTEAQNIKKNSYPNIDYIIFDEYMIEAKSNARYIKGFGEPVILLSIYHTIDRDEDRVKVFMLGNNTSFYNPYHIHPAFNVQPVKKGEIWKSKNVLYQNAVATEWVKAKKKKSKFGEMVSGSEYGNFANLGTYIEDEESFIAKHEGTAKHIFIVKINGLQFGIYSDMTKGLIYVSESYDPMCPLIYALTLDDQSENVLITKVKTGHLVWFTKAIKQGLLRYESMLIKKMCEPAIQKLL